MHAQVEKTRENNNEVNPPSTLQKSDKEKPGFVDNRPVTIAQRKLQSMVRDHPLPYNIANDGNNPAPFENLKKTSFLQQKPVVQRLTGFELELNIPFYGDAKGGITYAPKEKLIPKEETDIADFLFGGLDYGVSYGKEAGLYDISADHGSYRKKHSNLINTLTRIGFITEPASWEVMTNLEYRTEALEERDPDSQAKQESIAKKLQAHATNSSKRAKLNKGVILAPPVSSKYTGMPVDAFKKLVKGDGDAEAAVNETRDAIDPYLYYQETTGVLPSEIPEFFSKAAIDIGKLSPTPKSRANVSKTILELAVKMADNVIADGANSVLINKLGKVNAKSLKGWIALVAQYFLAYQIEVTSYCFEKDTNDGDKLKKFGGTEKNMVAYLSKTNIADTINALTPGARPDVKGGDKNLWIALYFGLIAESEKSGFNITTILGLDDYSGQNFFNKKGKNPKKIEHGEIFGSKKPSLWLWHILNNVKAFHVMTGNTLTLDDEQEKLSPALTIKGEQAIPLEDRKAMAKESFGGRDDLDQIENIIKKQWKEAVDRRTASTKERADYESYWKKADAFFKSFGDKAESFSKLKAFQTDFGKLSTDPEDVAAEHQKLSEFLKQTRDKLSLLVDSVETKTQKLITDYIEVDQDMTDFFSASDLDTALKKIKPTIIREQLPSLFNGLTSYFEVYKKIMILIEKTFIEKRAEIIETAKKIPKEKRSGKAWEEISTEYLRIKELIPSIDNIKAYQNLLKEIKKINVKKV